MANARDTEDLEALFEQISSETLARLDAQPTVPGTPPAGAPAHLVAVPSGEAAPGRVSDAVPAGNPEAVAEGDVENDDFYQRVGALTRQLHNALRELGYHQKVEQAVNSLPDTRQRLDYIARLTGQAAERALSNVEKGQEIMERVDRDSVALGRKWDQLFARDLGVDDFKQVAVDTHAFVKRSNDDAQAVQALLTDIMMAQDFHDLTGQVIQKLVHLVRNFEEELLKLLIESTPADKRSAVQSGWMNGPVIDAGSDDVVTDQAQVDDLLESLGF